ncbi:hypothetical protein IW262DRAFT_1364373 [Armillaria fumosa]|nr:hypothetical protein IW262DRAFT_1364373 [Armillaria fumosa]
MDETDPSTSALRDPTVTKEEKWRLMQESEDLRTSDGPGVDEIEEQDSPLAEEIFTAITMIVPFSFLLLMMEILIRYQYGKHPGLNVLVERMVSNVPILALLIFFSAFYDFSLGQNANGYSDEIQGTSQAANRTLLDIHRYRL